MNMQNIFEVILLTHHKYIQLYMHINVYINIYNLEQ